MNHCAIQQNAFSNREENRNSVSIPISERRNPVACPIPRRLGLLSDHPSRSLRFQFSHQSELCDSIAGTDFLEIILTKGYGMDNQSFCKQFFPFFLHPCISMRAIRTNSRSAEHYKWSWSCFSVAFLSTSSVMSTEILLCKNRIFGTKKAEGIRIIAVVCLHASQKQR
ncbi:hypothetical protein OIU78_006953 [Salix suchowensis]|nr:hypothetical protein OIU78_006953 [Salix suchowensis]